MSARPDTLATQGEQQFLEILARAQRRESELEAIYVDGHASAAQLAELEHIRIEIEAALESLGEIGYFNLS